MAPAPCESAGNIIDFDNWPSRRRLLSGAVEEVVSPAGGGRKPRARSLFLNSHHGEIRRTTKRHGEQPCCAIGTGGAHSLAFAGARLGRRSRCIGTPIRIVGIALRCGSMPRLWTDRHSGPARRRHSSARPERGTPARRACRYPGGRDCHPEDQSAPGAAAGARHATAEPSALERPSGRRVAHFSHATA
jgi:hypothetical protein